MFLQFLLLASLRKLYAIPIDPLLPSKADNCLHICDTSTKTGDNLRTTYGIVWSCLGTILACVWGAVHPNIPGPYDAGWTILKRRMTMTFCALLAPELMVMWALRQHYGAKMIKDKYNKAFVVQGSLTLDQSDRRGIVHGCLVSAKKAIHEWFTELPYQAAVRPKPWPIPVSNREPWTITHGHFVQMGGFMLYQGENPKKVLEFDYMHYLIWRGQVASPAVTEAELQERSKGNAVSKCVIILQTSWFVVQCLVRLASHLPLSELEVVTLAFAVMNSIVYWVWWDKPQGVDIAIPIHLQFLDVRVSDCPEAAAGHDGDIPTTSGLNSLQTGSALTPISGTDGQVNEPTQLLNDTREDIGARDTSSLQTLLFEESFKRHREMTESPPLSDQSQGKTGSSMSSIPLATRSTVRAHRARLWWGLAGSLWNKLKSFSKNILVAMAYPFVPLFTMIGDYSLPDGAIKVPIFYSYFLDYNSMYSIGSAASLIGALFGAMHFFAWASVFPSPSEQIVWRVSALTTTAGPPIFLLSASIDRQQWPGDISEQFRKLLMIVTAVAYVLSRIALLTVALLSLRALPKDVFVQVNWTSFIPHL